MAATETPLARDPFWLRATIRTGVRAMLPLPVVGLAWWLAQMSLETTTTIGLVIYAVVNLMLLAGLIKADQQRQQRTLVALLLVSVASDAILAWFVFATAGPLTLGIFPLYVVMVLKALCYRRITLWTLLVPALVGPVDLAVLYLTQRPEAFSTEEWLAFWGIVTSSVFFVVLLLVLAEQRMATTRRVSLRLEQDRSANAEHVAELEGIATDLRSRIRRQQTLEESLRAITGLLSLDAVLSQILDSLRQMLGSRPVKAIALTLARRDQFDHRLLSDDSKLISELIWAEVLASHVIKTRRYLLVGDASSEPEWLALQPFAIKSALSVPLIDPDDQVLGALTIVSDEPHLFTSVESRYLTSFSIQASIAIHNADLHTQLTRQRLLLEAVLRDIGDALLVVDAHGALLLGNSHAYKALQHNDVHAGKLREVLDQLNQEIRAYEAPVLTRELTVGEGDDELHYEIFASLVRVPDEGLCPVAFALHDVTSLKIQERQRVEFISMVSHELRNPLNTLNGFLKVVLQGKAGALNTLQQEFLALADEQADALKGRITELLEFNRLEAGRLQLHPDWSDLTDLLLMTVARFQLQADQAGLSIVAHIPSSIPELLMDTERVGQVVTNLIENAVKATPSGGTITVGVDVHERDVEVYVRDTGIGISPEEQGKIFDRFYQVKNRSVTQGVHLGLGLSICQQIIEGHNGRLWVESEEGNGSRFAFVLPMVLREQTISETVH
ncbi:ATP-binding protein [Candidatus Chloroploca sp. Khr17]|uniref:ATP-binding protein n=1 Tax=Candidatus Chloroploca sp. Khr17 TaxID=2496869 RepID=UPI00101C75F6|nr:ATP-binding protein [Candidatus Chloroploca sp. Khr17]